jgi:hypothetical protein
MYLNMQSRTPDKGWFFILGVDQLANKTSPLRFKISRNIPQGLGLRRIIFKGLSKVSLRTITGIIKRRRMTWAGHAARTKKRNAYRV